MVVLIRVLLTIILILFTSTATTSFAAYTSLLCKKQNPQNQFECYKVKRGDSWEKLFTDPIQRDLVMRINRMNTRLHPGIHIAIPKDLDHADTMDYSPFPKQISALGNKVIIVSLNPKVQAWGAYDEQGDLQNWGPVSGGKGWCPDIGRGCHTKIGKFTVYRKEGAYCKSTKFPVGKGGAPMPYCMFFNGGFALHGSYEVPGYNASHGCVRLFIPDAQWLNEDFIMDQKNVRVIINNQA